MAMLVVGALLGWPTASERLHIASAQEKKTTDDLQRNVLPIPEPQFKGKIGRTVKASESDFPKSVEAPKGAPNVLLILTDDVGFGASSTFGGPVPTPNMDRLAANGLKYNRFHTTALCSPTRAALISGRNHHSCATGNIMEFATGYPGYNSVMSKSCGTVAQVLRGNGYNTSWYGKNHNVPDWQSSMAGPFDLWPTGLGFEYFYGFVGGDSDQWHSPLFENTIPVEAEEQSGNKLTHLDQILADRAIKWIQTQNAMAPDKPFFAYYAPGLGHAPHHAPKDWIAKFKGQFDHGWDKQREMTLENQKKMGVVPATTKLTPRPEEIPAWNSLNDDQKKLYARMMEVYAGGLSHCDHQIGRVIDAIAETGELDNTLIIYVMGDNGASPEGTLQGTTNECATAGNGVTEDLPYLMSMIDKLGGPETYNHYPVGWCHSMNAPFQWTKQVASHFGGTRNGLVISWPKGIKAKGEIRSQFHHIIDIVPTILEAAKIPMPESIDGVKQKPLEGVSMVYSFDDAKAKERHTTQYFELVGNRGIYHEGWIACTYPARLPWVTVGALPNPDDFKWELYDVSGDFSEAENLAAKNPEKLKELQALFDVEAKKYNVYPLDSSFADRADPAIRPSLTRGRTVFTYYPGMVRIPEGSAPDVKNKAYTMTAEVEIPEGGANGVIATQGGRFGGWGLLILDGKPVFVHALSNQTKHKYRVASDQKLTAGKHTIKVDFAYDGGGIGKGGTATISLDGKEVAKGKIERTVGVRFSLDETFDVGSDTGTPVVDDYTDKMPFKFTGKLNKFVTELGKDGLGLNDQKKLKELTEKLVGAVE
ncbi:MAG: arylsulfatase [Planctomycetales bacterium 12-60-4]|nr:MAG: arylsulfatase [Planctomycetales bacterium 12-60-4]